MNRLKSSSSSPIITKICVRDADKLRDFHIDSSITRVVTDISSIINDDSIDLLVEVAGGTTFAKDAVFSALKKRKSVVTANKALIAEFLDDIIALLDELNADTNKKSVKFGYEASVCGGIPIIHTLQSAYKGDIINEICGICNGTTNFMLGKMEEGSDYDEVLREAQALGFAEADPTADVAGHDVRAKIAILAKLAFGITVPINSIPCMGITEISVVDFAYAKSMGCTIKLVGTAVRQSQFGEHDGALSVYVSPKLVPLDHLLASATGCGNCVAVDSANLGKSNFGGAGAGRYATANSIVADVMRVANGTCHSSPFPLKVSLSSIDIDNDFESAFYIRISFVDGLGIIRSVGELAESQGVSIHSILQQPIIDRMAADTVVTTEACRYSQVKALCALIEKEDFALSAPVFMPMISDY
jgi:homoserine dehydrogenase